MRISVGLSGLGERTWRVAGGEGRSSVQSPGANAASSYYVPGNKYASCPPGYTAVPDPGGGGTQCVLTGGGSATSQAPQTQAPQTTVSPIITVSPAIQTTVSPQISPVFQQAFQPSDSPMTAGTTQQAPVTANADTGGQGTSLTPAPAPGMQPRSDTAAYERMIEMLLSRQAQSPAPTYQAPSYDASSVPVVGYSEPLTPQSPSPIPQIVVPGGAQIIETKTDATVLKEKTPWLIITLIGAGALMMAIQKGKRK